MVIRLVMLSHFTAVALSLSTRLHSRAALSVLAVPASPVVAAALAAARAASAACAVGVWEGGVGGGSLGEVEGWPVRLCTWRHAQTVNSIRRLHQAVPIRVLTRFHWWVYRRQRATTLNWL